MGTEEETSEIEELFYQGSDLHGEGRLDEALQCFEKCLAIDADYADAILGKAIIMSARERHDEAIALAQRLIELDPEDVLAQTNLSMFHQKAGRIEEAEEAGAKARTLDWKRELAGTENPGDD
ncbi:tetratricopeptide repeat protein [Pseudomonas sp.]|uniref:tetratricopeptide repeat protein n=1 Tax=Pseudomonas sp. TaxID=306 RepID=UPI003982475F